MKKTRKESCLSGLSNLFGMMKKFIARNIDRNSFSEDIRKIAIVLVGAGTIGIVVDNDKVQSKEGWTLLVFGTIIWAVGLVTSQGAKK